MAEYLESHACRLYAHALHPDRAAALALAKKILAGALGTAFLERDVKRRCWTGLTDGGEVHGAIDVLIDYGWLVPCPLETGGRRTTRYWINPGVHTLHVGTSLPNGTDEADESPSDETSGSNGSAESGGES